MPCLSPLQASFSVRPDGKKDVKFSNAGARLFQKGICSVGDNNFALPCGNCRWCRLERSRQNAVRAMHEAQLYEDNCFVTLTYDDENLPAGGTLVRDHPALFMKSLRQKFSDRRIRAFGCGEYGDRLGRPHYHLCLFNCDFFDRKKWKRSGDFWLYTSDVLQSLWKRGFSSISDFSFSTAAYTARYCMKKVNGKKADLHYCGKLPEFDIYPTRSGGLGKGWYDRYGATEVAPFDEVVIKGVKCKPPRYYDKLLQATNPTRFEEVRQTRLERANDRADDNSYDRLKDKERCLEARFSSLVRKMENGT